MSVFPGDDPATTILCSVDLFRDWLSSGSYGLYIIATHGFVNSILVEPYCRSSPDATTGAISEHLAMLAWYRYTGEDLGDPDIVAADYDGDGDLLGGPNGVAEHYIAAGGILRGPPAGLSASDDDVNDIWNYALLDNDENGSLGDPGDGVDPEGDHAPGIRGNPDSADGDGEDGDYGLSEVGVGSFILETLPGIPHYGVSVRSPFLVRFGASTLEALVYVSACSAFGMASAWMNPPFSSANFVSLTEDTMSGMAAAALKEFFRALGAAGSYQWNHNVEEAFEKASANPSMHLAMAARDRCASRMVLYSGDVYVAITPRPNPTHGPAGSIANPHVVVAPTPAAYTIQQAMNACGPGKVVHVEPGTYPITVPLQVPDGVTIQGAGPHQTTLVAWGNDWIFFNDNLSQLSHVTTIQGFHLLNGDPAIMVGDDIAPGLRVPLLIRNNVFTWTNSPGVGVAVYVAGDTSWNYGLEGSAPLITNNVFYSMADDQYVVGVRTLASATEISHNTFVFMGPGNQTSGIEALWTGELMLSDPKIHNNVFVGSGIYRYASRPMMKQNTFWEAGVGDWYWDNQGHPTPEPTFGWHIDNDINVDPMHVVGPMAAYIGGAGNCYLDPVSPACGRADDAPTAEFHRRLTTRVDQQPAGPFTVRADRGCYYMIDCSGLPTFTPGTPTSTPGGPTATPTATPTSTPVPTGSPTSTPITGAYTEEFESGAPGWQAQGLWHLTASDAHDGATCAWYGQELPLGHYDTGLSNAGSLTSPLIQLAAESGLQLWSKEETEGSWDFDLRLVLLSTDAGATWEELARLQGDLRGWYEPTQVDLSEYAGLTVQLRLEFDTVDELFNGFLGWLVDDIYIGWLPTPIPTRTPTPSRTPTPWTVTMTPTRTPTIYVMPPLPSMSPAGTVLLLAVLGLLTAFSQARRVRKPR